MADVSVPEHGIAGHDLGDRNESGDEVPMPLPGEDALVDLLIPRVDPALDRARIHMRRKAEALVPWLAPPQAVRIGALPVRIEYAFVFPEAIEKGACLGELRVLPRHHLRL